MGIKIRNKYIGNIPETVSYLINKVGEDEERIAALEKEKGVRKTDFVHTTNASRIEIDNQVAILLTDSSHVYSKKVLQNFYGTKKGNKFFKILRAGEYSKINLANELLGIEFTIADDVLDNYPNFPELAKRSQYRGRDNLCYTFLDLDHFGKLCDKIKRARYIVSEGELEKSQGTIKFICKFVKDYQEIILRSEPNIVKKWVGQMSNIYIEFIIQFLLDPSIEGDENILVVCNPRIKTF